MAARPAGLAVGLVALLWSGASAAVAQTGSTLVIPKGTVSFRAEKRVSRLRRCCSP